MQPLILAPFPFFSLCGRPKVVMEAEARDHAERVVASLEEDHETVYGATPLMVVMVVVVVVGVGLRKSLERRCLP